MGEPIQVREGWWRQRCGDVVHVTRDGDCGFAWQCRSFWYWSNGRVDSAGECDVDLVEFLGEEIEIRRVR